CGIIGKNLDGLDIGTRQIKFVLGDIDADAQATDDRMIAVHADVPVWRMRACRTFIARQRPRRLFGRTYTAAAWTLLCGGRGRARRKRAGAACAVCACACRTPR